MKLILAFQHTEDVDNNFFEMSFASIRDDYAVSLQGQAIVVDDRNGIIDSEAHELDITNKYIVARRVQSALTSHEVSER
jgi:hypothetical protein